MPAALRGWLTDPHSLTSRIRARCRHFAVQPLRTGRAALAADGSDWAMAQLKSLKTKSPQSLKVTLRQLRLVFH